MGPLTATSITPPSSSLSSSASPSTSPSNSLQNPKFAKPSVTKPGLYKPPPTSLHLFTKMPPDEQTKPLDSAAAADSPSHSGGETEKVTAMEEEEEMILYGETQPVEYDEDEDEEDGVGNGICTWMKTQALEEEEEEEGETQVVGDSDCEIAMVDSDAETEDEGDREGEGEGDHVASGLPQSGGSCKSSGSNGSVRSIASIRAASIRSSGLAAAQSKLSFDNGENCTRADVILVDANIDEIDGNDLTEKSQQCTQDYYRDDSKSKTKNPVVKKLVYEEETTMGQFDLLSSPVPDNVAGLSYIESQEPGDMSQANALDVVDKFLGFNVLESSQEAINTGKTGIMKSPPKSSVIGPQCLAIKSDHRSPVGKTGTFEWIDNLEDEGGGEFFSRRKDSFFNSVKCARKSHSQPPKPRNTSCGTSGKTAKPSSHGKFNSDSRLMQNDSSINKKVHVSDTRMKKNLFMDVNEQPNSKSLEQRLEVADVDRGEGDMYEVGPDTQMAAEGIEALVHGPPLNCETSEADPTTGKLGTTQNEGSTKKNTSLSSRLSRKSASSIPISEKRKMLPIRSKKGSPICSRSKSRVEKTFECTAANTKSKTVKKKPQRNLNTRSSVSGNICSVTLKEKKAKGKADKSCNLVTLNVQLSVSKECEQGQFHVSSTPIARRTRRSIAGKLLTPTESVFIDNGKTRRTTAKRKGLDIGLDQNAEVEGDFFGQRDAQDVKDLHEGVEKDNSHVLTHPKRRRTRLTTLGDPNTNDNLNKPSVSVDNIQTRVQQEKMIVKFKTIGEIIDNANRKRRSISSRMTSENHKLTSDGRKAEFVSGVKTRSSLKTSLLKPNIENCPVKSLARPVVRSTASTEPCSSRSLKQGTDLEITEEDDNQDEPAMEELQPSVSKNVDAVSPVCMARDNLQTPGKRGRPRSSIAKELLHLETSNLSPASVVKMRRRKDIANVRILFSHHLDDDIVKHQKKIMGRLGVSLASSILDATHFVTDSFVRTRNMLEAVAQGKPVVTHMWLESCGQASCFIDEKNYILRDDKKEKEIGFCMPLSLSNACKWPLMLGRRVYITPNTKPSREVVSSLIKAAQGQPVERIGRYATKDEKLPGDLLVLSCEEDYSVCIPLLEKGAEIFSSELLLNGIVIQKLEYERHRLFLDHVKKTRSTTWLRQKDGNQFVPVPKCT